jgi:hypothetical protein
MGNGTNFTALQEGYMEFLANRELVPEGATLKSLTFDLGEDNPDGIIFINLIVSVPSKMQVVQTSAPQNAIGFPAYESWTPVSTIVGVETQVRAVAEDRLEIQYRFDSGGKVPNHPEFVAYYESTKKVAQQ